MKIMLQAHCRMEHAIMIIINRRACVNSSTSVTMLHESALLQLLTLQLGHVITPYVVLRTYHQLLTLHFGSSGCLPCMADATVRRRLLESGNRFDNDVLIMIDITWRFRSYSSAGELALRGSTVALFEWEYQVDTARWNGAGRPLEHANRQDRSFYVAGRRLPGQGFPFSSDTFPLSRAMVCSGSVPYRPPTEKERATYSRIPSKPL